MYTPSNLSFKIPSTFSCAPVFQTDIWQSKELSKSFRRVFDDQSNVFYMFKSVLETVAHVKV